MDITTMVTSARANPICYLVQSPLGDRPFILLDEALAYSLSVGGTLVPLVPAMAPCGAPACPHERRKGARLTQAPDPTP